MLSLPTTLPDWIAWRAGTSGTHPALVADRAWTYVEVDAEVTRLARRLAGLGVGRDDRVASLLHNCLEAAILPFALLRLGATLVPLNVRLAPAEVAWQLEHSAPSLVVVQRETSALLPAGTRGVSVDRVDGLQQLKDVPERDVPLRLEHDAAHVMAIIYTSGTTGRPRGAMLTVASFWWSAEASSLNLGIKPDDRWIACLPLFHVGGLSIVLRSAIYGTTAIVHERFDAAAVNRAIDDGATIVSVVPVMLQRMVEERGGRPYPGSFRCALVGGGPVSRALLERCARARVPVLQTYGLTECASQVATLAPADALRKLGSAGRPLHGVEVAIAVSDRAEDGEGEILVRGPIVMSGYFRDDDATATALVEDWLRTGDIGRLDADGYLYVLDRRDDLIVSGGENVYPAEVEGVLAGHAWIEECAVVGVPDDEWGQRVVGVVRLRAGTDASPLDVTEALEGHCRQRLAGYKVPREFRVVVEPLPRTASGKLRRRALIA